MIASNSPSNNLAIYNSFHPTIEPSDQKKVISPLEIQEALLNGNFEWLKEGILKGQIDPWITFDLDLEFETKVYLYQVAHFPQMTLYDLIEGRYYFASMEEAFSTQNTQDKFIIELSQDVEKREEIIQICNSIVYVINAMIEAIKKEIPIKEKEEELLPLCQKAYTLLQEFDRVVYKDQIETSSEIALFECLFAMGEVDLAEFVIRQANKQGDSSINYESSIIEEIKTKINLDIKTVIENPIPFLHPDFQIDKSKDCD